MLFSLLNSGVQLFKQCRYLILHLTVVFNHALVFGVVFHNLLLNVGPTSRGEFDYRAKDRLRSMGEWMHGNSRAIYECGEAPDDFQAPDSTLLTYNKKTNRLYMILRNYPEKVNASFMSKVKYAQFLHDGSEIKYDGEGFFMPSLRPNQELPVVEVFLK